MIIDDDEEEDGKNNIWPFLVEESGRVIKRNGKLPMEW